MDIVRQSLAITFVFVLLWAALWFLRKKGAMHINTGRAKARSRLLESRERLALTAQHSIHLVRIGDREVAVAVHPAGVTMLCDVASRPEPLLEKART